MPSWMTLVATYSFYFLFVFQYVSCFIALGTNLVNLTHARAWTSRPLPATSVAIKGVLGCNDSQKLTASTSFDRNMFGFTNLGRYFFRWPETIKKYQKPESNWLICSNLQLLPSVFLVALKSASAWNSEWVEDSCASEALKHCLRSLVLRHVLKARGKHIKTIGNSTRVVFPLKPIGIVSLCLFSRISGLLTPCNAMTFS